MPTITGPLNIVAYPNEDAYDALEIIDAPTVGASYNQTTLNAALEELTDAINAIAARLGATE